MIIETSSNQFFRIRDVDGITHAWMGTEVKRVKGRWVPKAKAREHLVRKLSTKVVQLETADEVAAHFAA